MAAIIWLRCFAVSESKGPTCFVGRICNPEFTTICQDLKKTTPIGRFAKDIQHVYRNLLHVLFFKTHIASWKNKTWMSRMYFPIEKRMIVSSQPCLFNWRWSNHLPIWYVGYLGSYIMPGNCKVLNSIITLTYNQWNKLINDFRCLVWHGLTIQVNHLMNFIKPGNNPDTTLPLPTSSVTQGIPKNPSLKRSPSSLVIGGGATLVDYWLGSA